MRLVSYEHYSGSCPGENLSLFQESVSRSPGHVLQTMRNMDQGNLVAREYDPDVLRHEPRRHPQGIFLNQDRDSPKLPLEEELFPC